MSEPRPFVPIASTAAMRARIRELASPERDDFDRAVVVVLDDFERLIEPTRQPPKRATRGSRLGWAYLGVKLPTPLKRQLDAAAAEAERTLTDEVTARLEVSFRSGEDAP